jgi:hypothetical protein
MSPQAAGAERRRLESDKAWIAIFNDQRHPLNKDYVARREELLRIEAQGKR